MLTRTSGAAEAAAELALYELRIMQSAAESDPREALSSRSLHCRLQEVGGTGSITAIQVKGPQSDWEGMANKWGAAWEIVHAPVYPLDIHLTNDQGQEVRSPCMLSPCMLSLQCAASCIHA